MSPLEKVRSELERYKHALMKFSAVEKETGEIELIIELRENSAGLHSYHAPIHPRDIGNSQFPWNFQRFLYDCLHDYVVELFLLTPQSRETAP